MKRCTSVLISLFFFTFLGEAQYKINRTKYDYRTYAYQAGDRYNPSIALITSLIIPGIGQMVSGEGGRGAVFIGGFLVCATAFVAGTITYYDDITHPYTGEGAGLMIAGGLGTIAIYIFGTIDAVRVAKVNSLAFRDKKTSFYITPCIDTRINSAGLTFRVSF